MERSESGVSPEPEQNSTSVPDVSLRGVTKRFGQFEAVAGIDLDVAPGQFVTLLGPSGCGKTTTLRIIGGFEWADSGRVEVAGEPVRGDEPGRHTRMVFQNYALFPHMTVEGNVAFGLRMDKLPKAEIKTKVDAILKNLGLTDHASKFPGQLSGGQQQRVALARALVTQPRVLLLDEPLGALDLKMRKRMQGELKALQRDFGITFIYVTHDQEEAMNLSDTIVVMEKGRIEQIGTPEEIYRRPASPYVANFVGETNLLPGKVTGLAGETASISTSIGVFPTHGALTSENAEVAVSIRPENIQIAPSLSSDLRRGNGLVHSKAFLGAFTRIELDVNGTMLIVSTPGTLDIAIGDPLEFGWRDEDLLCLPAALTPKEESL
ncbi:MAG: ABC transporter ATP-binding protein [Parvibaculaceae bacterium]